VPARKNLLHTYGILARHAHDHVRKLGKAKRLLHDRTHGHIACVIFREAYRDGFRSACKMKRRILSPVSRGGRARDRWSALPSTVLPSRADLAAFNDRAHLLDGVRAGFGDRLGNRRVHFGLAGAGREIRFNDGELFGFFFGEFRAVALGELFDRFLALFTSVCRI